VCVINISARQLSRTFQSNTGICSLFHLIAAYTASSYKMIMHDEFERKRIVYLVVYNNLQLLWRERNIRIYLSQLVFGPNFEPKHYTLQQ
jgi:hypothetical protein